MKKLQYLVSLILLISLGDETLVYSDSIQSVVFLISAFIFVEEVEQRRTIYFYLLILSMVLFNPFFGPWFDIEPIRVTTYIVVSLSFLLKTANTSVVVNHTKKELNGAY